jgi:hypothetical protein
VAQSAMVGLCYLPLSLGKTISRPPFGDKKHSPCGSVIASLEDPTTALLSPA